MDLNIIGISNIYFMLLLYSCSASTVNVSLELVNKYIQIGESITLKCTVNGIRTINPTVTRQWSIGKDGDLISNNGRSNIPTKYDEVVTGNTFSLTINNVSDEDLNVIYECRYGFAIYKTLLEIDSTKIKHLTNKAEMDVNSSTDDMGVTINIHLQKISALPNCSIEYLNMTLLKFKVTMYKNQEALLSVTIPSSKDTRMFEKDYHIVCYISDMKYYLDKPEKKEFNKGYVISTITVSSLLFCCVLLLAIMFSLKIHQTRQQLQHCKGKYPVDEKEKSNDYMKVKCSSQYA